ncbi:hypothetical protein Mgra_00003648 [Meloidogyne graminicola]|uniref:Uncharacterized protein n=1 Tax=Meloidogyne graminicola TaxID=189291 RepID=A0A8S9ZUN1_9BILA|nr:hypothetical protein Mgra_00003648 [Meloidogyne graminicola]
MQIHLSWCFISSNSSKAFISSGCLSKSPFQCCCLLFLLNFEKCKNLNINRAITKSLLKLHQQHLIKATTTNVFPLPSSKQSIENLAINDFSLNIFFWVIIFDCIVISIVDILSLIWLQRMSTSKKKKIPEANPAVI